MTLKSDPSPAAADDHPRRRAPWKWAMWVVVGVWRRELQRILRRPVVRCDHCDTANDHRWDNCRRSALFVWWRVPCWPMCFRKCGLCRRAMHVWDVHSCMISYSDSLGPSAPLSRYVISMANAVLQHLKHVTSDQSPTWVTESAQHCLWRDVTDVCSVSYVRDSRGCTKWDRRAEKMLSMFRLRNKKCSATEPN